MLKDIKVYWQSERSGKIHLLILSYTHMPFNTEEIERSIANALKDEVVHRAWY